MKVIKRIILILICLLASCIFFNIDKVFAQDAPFSEEPRLNRNSTGLNIQYMDLIEYNDGANGGIGTPRPYNCTERNAVVKKYQCSWGGHYYKVVAVNTISESKTGTSPSITSATGSVSWKKYNSDTYQVGPYKVNFSGTINKVTISTDKGSVTLNNNSTSSDGKYSVSNITSGGTFYIYLKKATGVKKINSVNVSVKSAVTYSQYNQYLLQCYETTGSHYDSIRGKQYICKDVNWVQKLEHYQHDSTTKTETDNVNLPGALGIIELNIYKRDKYLPDVGVPGAKYELWSDGKKQYSGTTDSSGHLLLDEVLIGDYIIKEVYVPYGFEIEGYATMNGKKFTDLTNMKVNLDDDSTMYVYNESYIDIGGIVFLDAKTGKANGPPNGYYDSGDKVVEGIEVKLYRADNNQELETKYTDSNGKYEFKHRTKAYNYYIRFKYNGQIYEATTYNETSAAAKFRSYATEGLNERRTFNNKFTPVNANHTVPKWTDTSNSAFNIYAYTGPDGPNNKKTYGKNNTTDELKNINLGIKERDIFDLNLRKDLVKVDVSINGKSHTYEYNGEGKDLEVTIRGTDIPDYERQLRKTDLQYKSAAQYDSDPDKLQVYVTYKIQIKNQSVGKITGYVLDLNDYADTSYQLVNSYDENGKAINWSSSGSVSGNGKTYNKIHTTSLSNVGITDKKWIFMQYKVSYDTLRELLSKGETSEENYAEIAGYKNTYTDTRKDTEGRVMANAGENAGLIDCDSTPDNMNPTSSNVQNFVKQSKTDAYQSLKGDEKSKRSMAVFEDDADVAPGLKLIRDDTPRTISGTVFEDSPLEDKLNNNERIGDGEYKNGENIVNKVKVELLCQNNEDVDTLNKVETRSNTDGSYTLSGYIPGDYLIKFTYGDYECLVSPQQNNQMYTGQDYKSTIYTEGDYKDLYWYNNTSPRKNDAVDDYEGRRQVVNSYSKDYKYDIAKVLNATRTNNSDLLETLAEKTYMTANTAKMAMEIEYLKDEKTSYKVQNVDFGIIERPRTKIVLGKNVSHIKLTSTDGTTIFDTNQSTSNLTWKENKYNDRGNMVSTGLVQGTVDENLLYGSTLNVRYTLEIRNHSEVDYNEKSYYVTGVVKDRSTMNRIEPTSVIEYVPNVLQYDVELTKANGKVTINNTTATGNNSVSEWGIEGNNDLWQILASKRENKNLPDSYRDTLLEAGAFDEANKTIDEILVTDLNGVKAKLARNDKINLTDVLTLTRVIARTEDTSNADEIQNIAEVIRLTIDNGRRPYYEDTTNKEVVEIPGNTYPSTLKNIEEVDTGRAEVLTFVVPFGANRQLTLIVIAIVSLGILVAGIVVIKKKVL